MCLSWNYHIYIYGSLRLERSLYFNLLLVLQKNKNTITTKTGTQNVIDTCAIKFVWKLDSRISAFIKLSLVNQQWSFCKKKRTKYRDCYELKIQYYIMPRDKVWFSPHYCDVIMSPTASQITSLTIVYSIVYSGTDQRKHQSSASLVFVRGIHRRPVNSLHKWPVTRKMFPFDDVIVQRDLLAVILVITNFRGFSFSWIERRVLTLWHTLCISRMRSHHLKLISPGQNGRHFADDIFRCNFREWKIDILIKISLKFVPISPIDNNPPLVYIMAWRRIGDKPLSEPMLTRFTDAYMLH